MDKSILENFMDYLRKEGRLPKTRKAVIQEYNHIESNNPFFSEKLGYATYGEWYKDKIRPKLEQGKRLTSYEKRVVNKYQSIESRHAKYHPTLVEARGHGSQLPTRGTLPFPLDANLGIGEIVPRTYNDRSKLGRYFNAVQNLYIKDVSKESKLRAKKTIQQLHKQNIYDKDGNVYHTPTLTETRRMYENGMFDNVAFDSGK